jgi:glycosyltransferase involved in cell wall biosynthesis
VASIEKSGRKTEIVVVDDGSTDQSVEVVKEWAIKSKSKFWSVNIISRPNGGAAAARNTGWQQASGDLIFFLDADDVWLPNHVSDICGLADEYPEAALLASAFSEVLEDGTQKHHQFGIGAEERGLLPSFWLAMVSGPMIVSSSTAAARSWALRASGGFPEGITHGEDKVGWRNSASPRGSPC